MKASSRASRAARSASQSAPVVSATTVSADSPASSTPDSSKVSRTAAQTRARAVASSVPSWRGPLARGVGPAQAIAWSKSRGSTPPPGRRTCRRRRPSRSAGAAGRAPAPSVAGRSSTTVAALRGSAGSRVPSANARASSTSCGRQLDADRLQTSTTSSTSTGASSGQHRDADGRAGVPAGVAEDLAEQLGDAVGDLRLAGEVGRRGDEDDHLDDPLDRGELTDLGPDRGERVQRALAGALDGLVLGDLAADLAGRISSPSRIGSWPEVKTWLPLRTAGMYAATGLATSGTRQPELRRAAPRGCSWRHSAGRLK